MEWKRRSVKRGALCHFLSCLANAAFVLIIAGCGGDTSGGAGTAKVIGDKFVFVSTAAGIAGFVLDPHSTFTAIPGWT
jgi:hypothetical protein